MAKIIKLPRVERSRYIFRNRPVALRNSQGDWMKFPCIVLYNQETDVPIAFPCFERWYLGLTKSEFQKDQTLYRKANAIRCFMNFMLWNTECNSIHELTINEIQHFVADYRYKEDDVPRDPTEWSRGIAVIYDFLNTYFKHNEGILPFKYNPADLISVQSVKRGGSRKTIFQRSYNKFGVKAIPKQKKKNRMIPYDHMDLILDTFKHYDPMLVFGIACQAFAGLREGEVVNLTRDSIRIEYGGFGRIRRIILDLTADAAFAINSDNSSSFGHIKRLRKQEVYTDFIPRFMELYNKHLLLIDGTNEDALFLNKQGKPMSVTTYTGRVRETFTLRFIPALKRACLGDSWAMNAPYIEAYEECYPGAHAFRHWFTMYLLTEAKLDLYEISKWRGDADPESMMDYVHVNARMIDIYNESLFRFQTGILENIYE